MKIKTIKTGGVLAWTLAMLSLLVATMTTKAQSLPCFDTNIVKFYNPPNVDGGYDVKDSRDNIVLADDFKCSNTGPITDIHLWGSWLNDLHGTIGRFRLSIYDDIPAMTNVLNGQIIPSHPGTNELWAQSFGPGQFAESPGPTGQEYFWNPTNHLFYGGDTQAWYYCFYPTNPFVQTGTAASPTNYWLAVSASQLPNDGTLYGWKTSTVHYNDNAVWGTVNAGGQPAGDWQTMTNIDLSFKLETTNPPPPTSDCDESNGVKYVQLPNLFGGLDVWNSSPKPPQVTDSPWWLADDFVCTNTGPISDIHLWGSWQNDQPAPGMLTFQLYVFDDVPVSPSNPYSHPGTNIIWHQTFIPGTYSETIWTNNAQENFYDAGTQTPLGPDSMVWYYCFNPSNLVQTGTASTPKVYWLAAFAETPAGTIITNVFGWKTTKGVRNDISVRIPWTGFGTPPPPYGWVPNYSIDQQPLDLAFKLTTPTNPCVVQFNCSEDKTIPCGSAWMFDRPTIIPSTCCPDPRVFFYAYTNSYACSNVYVGIWFIYNCDGSIAGSCTQHVTEVEAQLVMNCPTNKTVLNGSKWTFDTPTALDACSGITIPVTPVGTYTNGKDPCDQVYTMVWQAVDACSNTNYCSQNVTNVCPPIVCVETDGVKYQQVPNLFGGFDVWDEPYIIADDFVCTNTGYISDIHLWGSWLNDNAQVGAITFWLGIYDDVPAVTNINGTVITPSHPGTNLLWQQWLAPGQYAEELWANNAQENFMDPGSSNILSPDSRVWYYCFYPTNAFRQTGTATNQVIYWLAAHAELPPGSANYLCGWKTTTNVQHDVSVHANWPGVPPMFNPGWKPTVYQNPAGGPALPLDLSFKLTTCGPVRVAHYDATHVIVSWDGGGILQSAPTVIGPWTDVPGDPPSPFIDLSVTPPAYKFYRLRCY